MSYLVTSCPKHGTKSCEDYLSQVLYVSMARHCHSLTNHHNQSVRSGHDMWHLIENTECWVCCDEMVISDTGRQEDGTYYVTPMSDELTNHVSDYEVKLLAAAIVEENGIDFNWTDLAIKGVIDTIPAGYTFKTRVLYAVRDFIGWTAARAVLN